jgi:hypothetical protein
MGEAIVRDGLAFDERFCLATAERLWQYLRPATEWNNHFLQVPPAANISQFVIAAAGHKAIANQFIDQFADPEANWNIFATAERTRNYLNRHGIPTPLPDGKSDRDLAEVP